MDFAQCGHSSTWALNNVETRQRGPSTTRTDYNVDIVKLKSLDWNCYEMKFVTKVFVRKCRILFSTYNYYLKIYQILQKLNTRLSMYNSQLPQLLIDGLDAIKGYVNTNVEMVRSFSERSVKLRKKRKKNRQNLFRCIFDISELNTPQLSGKKIQNSSGTLA